MDDKALSDLLNRVAAGTIDHDQAMELLRTLPYADMGFARIDHHRELRTGFAEAIYSPGKSPDQMAKIALELFGHSSGAVVATRATKEQFEAIQQTVPGASFNEVAGLVVIRQAAVASSHLVSVVSAGTADQVPATECVATLEALGIKTEAMADLGVAGIHRILDKVPSLRLADVVVVVAGMEGALASVVAGLVSVPVVAVPTSAGYGAGVGGITPLLAMLNSCAPGVAVVNIDNGYGAAMFAATILRNKT
ncbi:MAG: nickel pincer cofactor biosynthesis protein LarB [Actinomycetota bacterium]